MERAQSTGNLIRAVAPVLLRRPGLLPTLVRQALLLAPRGWWRSWPPIPAPAPDYLHFRSLTAYGGEGTAPPEPDDVVAWLDWVRQWSALTKTPPELPVGAN